MAVEETLFDKLLQKDSITAVRRLIIGGSLAASALFGIPAIIATSVGSIALNAVVMNHEKKIQYKKLLNFYKDEIAAVQHKTPESVTIEDLMQMATPAAEGGKDFTTLHKELEELDRQQMFRIGASSISSLITSGILIAASMAFPGFLATGITQVLGLGLIGFGYTVIAKAVKATSQTIFGIHDIEDMTNQRLMRVAEEIKEKPANPVEIFGLFVDANPDLQNQIKENFKTGFEDLPVLQKKQVVEAYEPEFRVIALTEAMNKGNIKPSLVGLIASLDASDAMPGYHQYRALFNEAPHKMSDKTFDLTADDVALSEYRKRILAEREALGIKSLH